MRVYKFSVALVFITAVALLYVHQQVQLLKISYKIESNERELVQLLDQNKALMYNVTKLKSPVNLEKQFMTNSKEFNVAQKWQIVEVTAPGAAKGDVQVAQFSKDKGFSTVFYKIFGRPREAFANTIK